MTRSGVLLAIIASLAMGWTGAPAHTPGGVMIAVCGDPSRTIRLPVPAEERERRDCPAGCHALCMRRTTEDDTML